MATWYVRSDAAGGGDGSADTSAAAWTYAEYNALSSGDFSDNDDVQFTGTFTETDQLIVKRSNLTLRGPSRSQYATFIITRTGTSLVAVNYSSYVNSTLKWLDISGQADYALIGLTNAAAGSPTITECNIHDNADLDGHGIRCANNQATPSDFGTATITNCTFSGISFGAILMNGTYDNVITDNIFDNNGTVGQNYDAIQLDINGSTACGTALIQNNIITNHKGTGAGIDVADTTSALIKQNKVTSSECSGITVNGSQAATTIAIEACICDVDTSGIFIYNLDAAANPLNVTIKQCYFNGNIGLKIGSSGVVGDIVVDAKNSIIKGDTFAWQTHSPDTNFTITESYNNILGALSNHILDTSDITTDPVLTHDYALQPTSPCIGAGAPGTSNTDYYGAHRLSNVWDIGAVWYGPIDSSQVSSLDV